MTLISIDLDSAEKSPIIPITPVYSKFETAVSYNHWEPLHTEKNPTPQWFANWESRIPCGMCRENYKQLRIEPRFDDWFAFTWELHNKVNAKIGSKELTLERAIRTWKPVPNRSPINGCRIVTAFGPKRIERQQHCLDTWLRSGFRVTALQTAKELESFPGIFSGVDWVQENATATGYNFATQRIRRLVEEATNEPILLLNSDCALAYGDGLTRFKQHLKDGFPKFYLRWNYTAADDVAKEFQWGLDGLLVWPEDIAAIPENAPYGIGHAMWDYAVPIFLREHGRGFTIDHYPWLMHQDHPQNWIEDSWQLGFNWLHRNGYDVDYDSMRNGRYRKSLDPGMVYLGSKWVYPSGLDAV